MVCSPSDEVVASRDLRDDGVPKVYFLPSPRRNSLSASGVRLVVDKSGGRASRHPPRPRCRDRRSLGHVSRTMYRQTAFAMPIVARSPGSMMIIWLEFRSAKVNFASLLVREGGGRVAHWPLSPTNRVCRWTK